MKSVKIYHEPKLVNPCLIAAWPGVGNVALIAATYLKDGLGATEFGEIEMCEFFDVDGVFINDNIIEVPQLPTSKFYYWNSGDEGKDIIILLAETQPGFKAYEYASTVIDVAQKFGVKRVYTLAASLTEHYPSNPRVLGAASVPGLLDEFQGLEVVLAGDFYIAGLNGLLLGVAKERGIEGLCLLGETAKYAAKIANPIASQAVLRILTKLLGIEIDMAEMDEFVENMEKQIKEISDEMRREFLQRFTKPIWEREEYEEN
ncbi:MAG: PAC2 family protein [Chloroflexota bacterium]|nr:PAC2 family protein [Chloroflexota bacterium]